MTTDWRALLWAQFGASIDMLEGALDICPDAIWADPEQQPAVWYLIYHTLFFLDLSLDGRIEGFAPPPPFTLDELDPAGIMPERPFTKAELRSYLHHAREKCRTTLAELTTADAQRRSELPWIDVSMAELYLYNLRHVQHHVAQVNLLMRQRADLSAGWVKRAATDLTGAPMARG